MAGVEEEEKVAEKGKGRVRAQRVGQLAVEAAGWEEAEAAG